jgi:hypothetical protein
LVYSYPNSVVLRIILLAVLEYVFGDQDQRSLVL